MLDCGPTAWRSAGDLSVEEADMFLGDRYSGLEPADATVISYTLLRHLCFTRFYLGTAIEGLRANGLAFSAGALRIGKR